MLDWFATQRFAPNDSPFRERRLCLFSPVPGAPVAGQPDAHDADAEGHNAEAGHENTDGTNRIGEQTGDTRSRIGGLFEKPKERPTIKNTTESLKTTVTGVEKLQEKFKSAESLIKKNVSPNDQKKHLEILSANTNHLADGHSTLTAWAKGMEDLDQWSSGNMVPEVFFQRVAPLFAAKKGAGGQDQVNQAVEEFYKIHPDAKNWQSLNQSTRIFIASVVADGIVEFVNSYIEKMKIAVQEQLDYIESLNSKGNEKKGGSWSGVELLTANEFLQLIMESSTNVVNAFKKAREEWLQLKIAGVSHSLGKATQHLPFGQDALQSLEGTLAHKDDEVKNHYVEHLEADLASFPHMIGEHGHKGFLEKNMHDGNRFRGSLEYMAKKGWLYDVQRGDPSKKSWHKVMGYELIPGKTLPSTWSVTQMNEYITDLEGKNQQGQEAETKRGYSRVDFAATIDSGMKVMLDELDGGNYWAVRGIFQRLLGKAKEGHTATWLATTLMRYLRDHPLARRYFPIELFDRLGNESLIHLASTNFWWVADRRQLRKWGDATWDKSQEESDSRMEQTGVLGKVTYKIENLIKRIEKQKNTPEEDRLKGEKLDLTIAKFLCSQVVDIHGVKASIFSSEFDDYRAAFKKTEGTTVDPTKTDDDFTKADSEIVMHGPAIASAIVAVRSPADLIHRAKAVDYLAMLIRRDRDLAKAGLSRDQENLRRETRETFRIIFTDTWNKDASQGFWQLEHSESNAEGMKVLQCMIEHKLIDINLIRNHDSKLCIALCEQLGIKHNIAVKKSVGEVDKKTQDYAQNAKSAAASAERSAKSCKESVESLSASMEEMRQRYPMPRTQEIDAAFKKAEEAFAAAKIEEAKAAEQSNLAKKSAGDATGFAVKSTEAVAAMDEKKVKELNDQAKAAAEAAKEAEGKVEDAVKEFNKQKSVLDKFEKWENQRSAEERQQANLEKQKQAEADVRRREREEAEARAEAERQRQEAARRAANNRTFTISGDGMFDPNGNPIDPNNIPPMNP